MLAMLLHEALEVGLLLAHLYLPLTKDHLVQQPGESSGGHFVKRALVSRSSRFHRRAQQTFLADGHGGLENDPASLRSRLHIFGHYVVLFVDHATLSQRHTITSWKQRYQELRQSLLAGFSTLCARELD
jgi:hypothetical protein